MYNNFYFAAYLLFGVLLVLIAVSTVNLNAGAVLSSSSVIVVDLFHPIYSINPYLPSQSNYLPFKDKGLYTNEANVVNPAEIKCHGTGLCLKGDVVKVVNGKTIYVSINNKIYRIDLALVALPISSQQRMIETTTFTRNACLGGTVLIDQDDGQRGSSIVGMVYCSPTKSLNAMLLDTGLVELDRLQCGVSEFANSDWGKSHGC